MDVFINNTFDQYQAGELNSSDLVDPYLGAREYSPNASFNEWALRSLLAAGYDGPENLSNIGEMDVTNHETGARYTGILMSDGQPEAGFVLGENYDAGNVSGSQFVVTENNTHELTGLFTVNSATDAEGKEIQENITYKNITYETANTTEYAVLQQRLQNLTAQINARQQTLRNSGGGGLFDGFGFSLGGVGGMGLPVVLLAAAAAVLVLGRD
jgi:hypothetical protein